MAYPSGGSAPAQVPSAPGYGAPTSEVSGAYGQAAPPPPEPPGRVPRFPWISLTVMLLAAVGVAVAIGLAISAGIEASNRNDHAKDVAPVVEPHQRVTIPVSGPGDTVHVWATVPADAAAWRADGTLALPDNTPFTASQGGRALVVDDVSGLGDGFGYDGDSQLDGSGRVELADVHPLDRGKVEITAGSLAPPLHQRLVQDPPMAAVHSRLAWAGVLGVLAALAGVIAFITFIVLLVRRSSANKPRRPAGPAPPYGGYFPYQPYQPYQPYPAYPGYPTYPGQPGHPGYASYPAPPVAPPPPSDVPRPG